MTATQESGRHVTPERIRAGGEKMERDGFELVYERPLAELGNSWLRWYLTCRGWAWGPSCSFRDLIPGEDGRTP